MERRIHALKYLFVFTLPGLCILSFSSTGWITFTPLLESFLLIPLLELLFKPDPTNIPEAEEAVRKEDWFYDLLIYLVIPVQFLCLYLFLSSVVSEQLTLWDRLGRTTAMGLMCGVIGINVAHELGHRSKKYERVMSKVLLLSSLYMHFFIEHNRGHHKHVATDSDPASSRRGESLYAFWLRSTYGSYLSAWRLEKERLQKKELRVVSFRNEMLMFQILQIAFCIIIYLWFGSLGLLHFLLAATMGFLLLETVNYIEHYGLRRKAVGNGRHERVLPAHSWNSDHVVGRVMLFELSRHSDHHYLANRKYQVLRHLTDAPQMPTGYPGMMLMSLLPPLWFRVMDRELEKFHSIKTD